MKQTIAFSALSLALAIQTPLVHRVSEPQVVINSYQSENRATIVGKASPALMAEWATIMEPALQLLRDSRNDPRIGPQPRHLVAYASGTTQKLPFTDEFYRIAKKTLDATIDHKKKEYVINNISILHIDFGRYYIQGETLLIAYTDTYKGCCTQFAELDGKDEHDLIKAKLQSVDPNIAQPVRGNSLSNYQCKVKDLILKKGDIAHSLQMSSIHRRGPIDCGKERATLVVDYSYRVEEARQWVNPEWAPAINQSGVLPNNQVDDNPFVIPGLCGEYRG